MEMSEHIPVNLICVSLLGALLLRRLVRMERFHWPRVVLLTLLLWVPTVYLFVLGWSALSRPYQHSCVTLSQEPGAFTISE